MCCMVTISMLFMFLLGSGQSYELHGPGTLRSLNKNVTGSSQDPDIARFDLSFAVDGSTRRDSSLCRCCASTQRQDDPWIQIDLGRLYRVGTVEVIGRTDYNDPFNMDIFVTTTNTSWQGSTPTQPTLPDEPEQYHNVTFSYPVIGQFVTLQLNGNVLLCVCEVNIYSKDCSNGTYGLYCNETCGQCQDGETCDFVTGRCTHCLPGYQLPLCTEECMPGTFGPDCSFPCHCKDNMTCDHVNGSCPDNKCDVGWQGSNCSLDALISLNAKVRASSVHHDSKFALSRAVDGSTSMDSTACRCCAATKTENQPWIQINLGRLFRAATVKVASRTDWQDGVPFSGMHIYLHEKRDNWTLNHALVRIIPEDGSRKYITTVDSPVIAQYITLQLTENNVMLLVCEVSVYSSDCSPGTYGLYCNETCGQCRNGEICDHVTGFCTQCLPGYQFPFCKKECLPGSFGTNCFSTCHCQHNLTCNRVNGSCPEGCDVGWHGSNCSQECPPGTYGLGCNKTCGQCQDNQNCNHVTGNCVQCALGYQFLLCKEICLPGTFGSNCSSICHCYDNVTCNRVTGYCLGGRCDLGWQGFNCSQVCFPGKYGDNCSLDCGHCRNEVPCDRISGMCYYCQPGYTGTTCHNECPFRTFGLNCSSICHCYDNMTCDHVTGSCPQNRCYPGWKGSNCSQVCPPGRFGHDCAADCNCHKNKTCDHVTGECPDNICDVGWMGSNCSTECDSMTYGNNCAEECGHCYEKSCDRRTGECRSCSYGYTGPRCMEGTIHLRATEVHVSMSSVHAGMDATKAIDGLLVDDPETCQCCSETTYEYHSWWQVDLGKAFLLKQVIVYGGRNENNVRQLVGFTILTSLTDEFLDKPAHIQNGEIQDSKQVVFLPDVAARYVRIQRFGILTICEVEIVPSDIICPVHTYGSGCSPCGPCKIGSCDPITGDCPSGCYDGYDGIRCEKPTFHNDVIIGVIGAGVGVVTSFLVVGLIAAVLRFKKLRIRTYEEPSVRWAIGHNNESAYDTLENQEVVIGNIRRTAIQCNGQDG